MRCDAMRLSSDTRHWSSLLKCFNMPAGTYLFNRVMRTRKGMNDIRQAGGLGIELR
jgi:hypothetical protein